MKKNNQNRGGNRLKHQVNLSLQKINMLGVSKHQMRTDGNQTGIHSISQLKNTLSSSQQFAEWARGQGIKDLFQLKRSHYRDYIEHKREEGVSNGHLINIETDLRLLSKGMTVLSESKGFTKRDWVPKTRLIDVQTREGPKDRSLSQEQLDAVYEKLSDAVKAGADLQLAFGLRLREASRTKAAHIIEREGRLFWIASSDKQALNASQGVTKAGRERETPCRAEYEQTVRELLKDKQEGDYIVPVQYNTLKSGYNRAGMTGSHAFRHTYARSMLHEEFKNRDIELQGSAILQRMLENREAGFRKDKGFTKEERPLYQQVADAMDQVQSHLGHGQGRIDLAQVYLKGA